MSYLVDFPNNIYLIREKRPREGPLELNKIKLRLILL